MDCGGDETPELFKMINPEIISRWTNWPCSGTVNTRPDSHVERPAIVEVKYTDITGGEQRLTCEGLLAACVSMGGSP